MRLLLILVLCCLYLVSLWLFFCFLFRFGVASFASFAFFCFRFFLLRVFFDPEFCDATLCFMFRLLISLFNFCASVTLTSGPHSQSTGSVQSTQSGLTQTKPVRRRSQCKESHACSAQETPQAPGSVNGKNI